MKWKFFTMIPLLLIQINIYAQYKNANNDKNILSQQNSDEKMFKYLNLSDDQTTKIQAIRKNRKANLKALKDIPGGQNILFFNIASTQDSIDNLLSPVQKMKMRKLVMKESYTEQLKQKVNLSQNQEDKIETICELSYDKQQAIINNPTLSQEDIKQQVGKINNETSDKITGILTVEQKKQLEIKKENTSL